MGFSIRVPRRERDLIKSNDFLPRTINSLIAFHKSRTSALDPSLLLSSSSDFLGLAERHVQSVVLMSMPRWFEQSILGAPFRVAAQKVLAKNILRTISIRHLSFFYHVLVYLFFVKAIRDSSWFLSIKFRGDWYKPFWIPKERTCLCKHSYIDIWACIRKISMWCKA